MLILSATASAASVHLKGGRNAEPSFSDIGLALTADGELSGLGNGDVLVTLTARADVTSTCTNQGGNQAPGQNPAPLTVTGSEAIPEDEIKNGTTPFSVETVAPPAIIAGAPGCPNTNWTEAIEDLAFTSADDRCRTASRNHRAHRHLHLDPPTDDGSVSAGDVTCTQS